MADHGLTWGVLPAGTFERLLVFSPHFDDAAMGAGHLLLARPGSTVVTVFAGRPERYPAEPTEWDALGGFRAGDDVVAIRRTEDEAALAVLGAEHRWLEFVDHQYLEPEDARDTRADGARARKPRSTRCNRPRSCCRWVSPTPTTWRRTTPGCSSPRRAEFTWFGYEDAGYKHIPGMLAWRVSKLFQSDFWPTPMIVPTRQDHARKRAAIECYRSQLAPLRRGPRTRRHGSTAQWPSSSGCSRLRPPAGSGCDADVP